MCNTSTMWFRRSVPNRVWVRLLFVLFLSGFGSRLFAYDLTVAQDGTGNYTTVQAAINAAPTGRTTAYTIFIKDGIYSEKITVPTNKPFLQLVGQSVANTILIWNDNALTPNGSGGTVGTGGSGSFTVNASDFSALNITFVNSFGDGSQAVAVSLYGDRAAFKNCRFLGNQDTLLTYGTAARQYFKDCYIDGNVDFIFGSAVAIFDNCTIYAKTRVVNAATSYITAANTPAGQTYGYLFRNAKIPSNQGTTLYYLGRPWQNSTGFSTAAGTLSNPKVIFMKTRIGANVIQPAGWVIWDAGTDVTKITYGEYRTRYFNGNSVNTSQRVSWSQQLAPADTVQYTTAAMFGTWDPCSVATGFCTTTNPADIAVSNFRASKGATQTTLDWNISWAMTGIQYDLLRSSDNVTFSQINTVTATNDSTYNFRMTDALPAAGTAYYYKVRASKAGLATHTTPALTVSSVPTITITGTTGAFTQYQGTPSAAQSYTVAGSNLTGNLTITAPANFELSTNGGTTWLGSSAPIVLTPTANAVGPVTVSVRLNAAAVGTSSGNITHTSPGATAVSVAVAGSRVATAAPQSNPLAWWPLKLNNQDSTAVRSALVTTSASTLRRLYVSNGTAVTTIPAYSPKFGQAFGPSTNGDGTWSLVGGNLSRGYYEQFTVTAGNSSVRVDSLLATSAFYNTSSNTKLAVVYSRSNFRTDSTDVTGGTLLGVALPATANGAFATPILLANQTGGPTSMYRLALNGSTGVTLTAGQTLTIRLYFACGSTSVGRYAFLKNVVAKGAASTVTASHTALAGTSLNIFPNPTLNGRLTVELSGYRQPVDLVLYNAVGQRVLAQTVAPSAAPQLELSGLAPGVYVLRATTAGGVATRRVVVGR